MNQFKLVQTFGGAVTQLITITDNDFDIAGNCKKIRKHIKEHPDDINTAIAWGVFLKVVGLKKKSHKGVSKYFWIAEDVTDGRSYEADTSAELAEKLDLKTSSVVNVRRSGKLLHRRYKITRKKKKAQ